MPSSSQLYSKLQQLDGKPYGALKQLTGSWVFDNFTLHIDKVQSDPYAPASRLHLTVPLEQTGLPAEAVTHRDFRVATADFIARDIADAVRLGPREFGFVRPGQEILQRSSVVVGQGSVSLRLTFQFPALGRRIRGRQAARLLVEELPKLVRYSAIGEELDPVALAEHTGIYRDYLALRGGLADRGLVAFVADGAVLPRSAGDSDTPLEEAVPFVSPDEFAEEFVLPGGRRVRGMGVRAGVTLIVGGGFHGKSTLLRALERGVYAHVPGDGRELVATDPSAVMVRAEDGRAVTGTDISPFINNLPGGTATDSFFTQNASGSTSQAANLAEALEMGASTLLIDEDTSATNFMIRDSAMKELIAAEHEPITPFVDRVRALYRQLGVSTLLVVGGSGAFFPVADQVIGLQNYRVSDLTRRARAIGGEAEVVPFDFAAYSAVTRGRRVDPGSLVAGGGSKPPRGRGLEQIQMGRETLDLRYLSQLVDSSQTNAIALSLGPIAHLLERGPRLSDAVAAFIRELEESGLDILVGADSRSGENSRVRGDLALPRAAEIYQAISRWRRLRLLPEESDSPTIEQ